MTSVENIMSQVSNSLSTRHVDNVQLLGRADEDCHIRRYFLLEPCYGSHLK